VIKPKLYINYHWIIIKLFRSAIQAQMILLSEISSCTCNSSWRNVSCTLILDIYVFYYINYIFYCPTGIPHYLSFDFFSIFFFFLYYLKNLVTKIYIKSDRNLGKYVLRSVILLLIQLVYYVGTHSFWISICFLCNTCISYICISS
jgi:hypothetical protein